MEENFPSESLMYHDNRLDNLDRDIPGERFEEGAISGLSPLLQISDHGLCSPPEGASLIQNSAASPMLRRSQNKSQADGSRSKNMEQVLFTPIKMLDFNDIDDGEDNRRAPPASLSKSSTPNPKSAKKMRGIISPERAAVLSVNEIETSPILEDDYMERDMEREVEHRLMEAGRLGEESPSDRGSRERSPVIDGAEHEDTLQNRFQQMQARVGRQDTRGRSSQKQMTFPSQNVGNGSQSQMYPVRVGPNHRNDSLVNYNISRPSCPQGQAQNDIDSTQAFQVPRVAQSAVSNVQSFQQNHPGANRDDHFSSNPLPEKTVGFPNTFYAKGGNFFPPNFSNFGSQLGALPLYNQNQSAHSDKEFASRHSVSVKSYEAPEVPHVTRLLAEESTNSYFTHPLPGEFISLPQPSQPSLTGELSDFHQSEKDMDEVWGHLRKVIKQGQVLVGSTDGDHNTDGVNDLLSGQGQSAQGQGGLDFSPQSQGSSAWFETRGQMTSNQPGFRTEDSANKIWGENSARFNYDPTMAAENRYLKEILEKERYRRKHCENHIHQLNAKLLETQQQLAVVIAQDRRKDSMVEQLDKQFGQVVDGWRRKETEIEEEVKQLKTEKFQMGEAMEIQTKTLKKFESELTVVVDELKQERQNSALTVETLKTQLSEQARELTSLHDLVTSERDRANLMTSEWEHVKDCRHQSEVKLQHVQEQLQKEQDNWFNRERQLLQKLDELTDSNLRAIQEEKNRTEEKGQLVEDVEKQLKMIMTEMNRLEMELDAAMREKESLKVEMSLNEAKAENSLTKLETELKSQFEQQLADKMSETRAAREELEQKFSERLRKHVDELTNEHRAEITEKTNCFQEFMKEAESEVLKKTREYEDRLNILQTENSNLKSKKHKLEIQRTEVLSKLQLLMQSQWNEALSLLGTSSPSRADQNTYSNSRAGAQKSGLTTANILSGLNLSLLSQPSGLSTANTTLNENTATTPTRENILSLINGSSHTGQPSSHNPQNPPSLQQSAAQQNQPSADPIGSSLFPSTLSDFLNSSTKNGSPTYQNFDGHQPTDIKRSPTYNQGDNNVVRGTSRQQQRDAQDFSRNQPGNQSAHSWLTPPRSHGDMLTNQILHVDMVDDYQKLQAKHGQLDLRHSIGQSPTNQRTVIKNPSYQNNNFNNSQVLSHVSHHDNHVRRSQETCFHGNQNTSMSPNNRLPDVSLISTIPSHRDADVRARIDPSNQAVPIRSPQQRSRPPDHTRDQRRQNKSAGRRRPSLDENSSLSPRESDDVTHRLRDYSDETGSYTGDISDVEEIHGPRRLDFSPPTKQPRPPGVRPTHNASGEERHGESVLEESLRLNEEYNDISDKLELHESRQSELQHYIQMLLERSPGSPTPNEGETTPDGPNSSLASAVHYKLRQLNHGGSPKLQQGKKLSSRHAIFKTNQQQNQGSLQSNQLEEIARLLSLYGSQEAPDGGDTTPQSPPTTHLLQLLQHLHLGRVEQSNQESRDRRSSPSSNQNPSHIQPMRREKSRRQLSSKHSMNTVSRDGTRSSSSDRTPTIKHPPSKRPERKPSSATPQTRNSVPKWK